MLSRAIHAIVQPLISLEIAVRPGSTTAQKTLAKMVVFALIVSRIIMVIAQGLTSEKSAAKFL